MNPEYLPIVIDGQKIDISMYIGAKLVAENAIYKFYQCDNTSLEFSVNELVLSSDYLSSAICKQVDGQNLSFIVLGK